MILVEQAQNRLGRVERMSPFKCIVWTLVAAACPAWTATAQPAEQPHAYRLTLADALERARRRSPAIAVAHAEVSEAQARLTDASLLLRHNTTLELEGGPRFGPDGAGPEIGVHVGQVFELGGQRGARIGLANAAIDRARHLEADTRQRALVQVARTFLEARYADELLVAAKAAHRLTGDLHRVASSRGAAGDVGGLDVELAALATARTAAEVRSVRARRDRATGALRTLLQLEPGATVSVVGALFEPRTYALDELLSRSRDRPDLRAVDAEVRATDAAEELAEAEAWPDLGVRLGYVREEQANVVLLGLSIGLPTFQRGQGARELARARRGTLRLEREWLEARLDTELRAAMAHYQALAATVREFEERGTPRIEASEALTRRSYEAGAMPLAGLLAVLRELVSARRTYSELLFRAALARVELEALAGIL